MTAAKDDPAARHGAARAAALYLLSLTSLTCAHLAWSGRGAAVAAAWAVVLGAALVAGEVAAPAAFDLRRTWRARGRLGVSIAYATLLFLAAMMVAGAPSPGLLARMTLLLAAAQAAALALGGAMEDRDLALANAYALAALAALRGGTPAVVAALALPAAHALFLARDGAARTLSAYGARRGPGPRDVAGGALRLLALPLAALFAWLVLVPPRPYPGIRWEEDAGGADAPAAAFRLLALVALIGTAGVYAAAQLLRRRRRRDPPLEEVLDAAVIDDEPAGPGEVAPGGDGASAGGRVVRAYLVFLARAAGFGFVRRADWTPREFADALRTPAGPLQRLTSAFMDARYGETAAGEAQAAAAEAAAAEVLADLKRRRRPARQGAPAPGRDNVSHPSAWRGR